MNIINFISDIFFPPQCLFCKKYMPAGIRPIICENCQKQFDAFTGKCSRCHTSFVYKEGRPHCNTCKSARHPFDGVVSAYFYSGGVRRSIIEHKFNFSYNNSKALAFYISKALCTLFTENLPDAIIPVPSCKERLWERGYDPLLEISEEVSQNTGIPILENVLIKHKYRFL